MGTGNTLSAEEVDVINTNHEAPLLIALAPNLVASQSLDPSHLVGTRCGFRSFVGYEVHRDRLDISPIDAIPLLGQWFHGHGRTEASQLQSG